MTVKVVSTADILAEQKAFQGAAAGGNTSKDEPEAISADADDLAETGDESGTSQTEQEEKEETSTKEGEEEEDEAEEKGEQPASKKPRGGFQRKIDKVTKNWRTAEAERDQLRAELEKVRAGTGRVETKQETAKVETVEATKEPDSSNFEKHEDYLKALVKWDRETAEHAKETKEKQTAEQGRRLKVIDSYNESLDAAKEKFSDFQKSVDGLGELIIPANVVALIYESDNGGELSYHLAKNPDELKRICALAPEAAARAMGRFEAKHVSAPDQDAKETKEPKKITNAPAPMRPVGGKGSGASAKTIYDPNLTQREFEELMDRAESAKRA